MAQQELESRQLRDDSRALLPKEVVSRQLFFLSQHRLQERDDIPHYNNCQPAHRIYTRNT